MTKLFLILLLITKHSFINGAYREPEIYTAIFTGVDFSRLTAEQDALYSTQKESPTTAWAKPIHAALAFQKIDAVDWLLAKKVDLHETVLVYTLKPGFSDVPKAKIVISVLKHGAPTNITFGGKKPADYMLTTIAQKEAYYKVHPESKNEAILHELKHSESVLRRYDDPLLWTWIKATALIDSGRVEIIEETHK